MKKIILLLALMADTPGARAQEDPGDLYHGMTKKLALERMIPPYGLEVTYDKTVHIIFPAAIRYVDLGSQNIMAGKADGADNVLRVKATVRGFAAETNMSVITDNGAFYAFNVRYSAEPRLLNIEMQDTHRDHGSACSGSSAVCLEELGSESPRLVDRVMHPIHRQNRRHVRHLGSRAFGIRYLVRGLYTRNGLLYLHTQLRNGSNIPFDVDFVVFKIVDRKIAKRTAIQERSLLPIRSYNHTMSVAARRDERTVFVFEKFTIPNDKQLVVELHEKNGGRHQRLVIRNEDLVRARRVDAPDIE